MAQESYNILKKNEIFQNNGIINTYKIINEAITENIDVSGVYLNGISIYEIHNNGIMNGSINGIYGNVYGFYNTNAPFKHRIYNDGIISGNGNISETAYGNIYGYGIYFDKTINIVCNNGIIKFSTSAFYSPLLLTSFINNGIIQVKMEKLFKEQMVIT